MHALTILLQIDACRANYINKKSTPFMSYMRQRGISGTLIPTFGFEPDAAYIAGLYPDKANGGAQFWLDPEKTPFYFIRAFPKWLNEMPTLSETIVRKTIKLLARRYCHAPTLSTAKVPLNLLKYFGFPMKYTAEQPGFVRGRTVFDLLRNERRAWLFHCYPNNKVDIKSALQRVDEVLFPPCSFAFVHIGNLDLIGHRYGPESKDIKKTLLTIDKGIKCIYNIAKERFKEVHLVIMGDHGMMQVNQHLNICSELKKLSIKLEKDYLVFLDSTMVRFWFFSEIAEKLIVDLLNKVEGGHILRQDEKDKYHLNYHHNKFGDIIFLVDPGVLIYPNFYQNKKPVKGMHGYAPETPDQQSAILIHSPNIMIPKKFEEPIDMRRVFPTLLDLMGMPIPESTNVKSLLF